MSIERALRRGSADVTAAAERLAAAAGDLMDVAYASVDTPVGPLAVAATPRGLVTLSFDPEEQVAEELAHRISPRVLRSPARLDDVRRELDEYFERRRTTFDVPLDRQLMNPFARQVLRETSKIRYGSVLSYGEVARRIDHPRAARAVGNALGSNPIGIIVPCHRVIRGTGEIGHYGGGAPRKQFLLELEGAIEGDEA